MKKRMLGAHGPSIGAIGLGCMSFAGFFGETDEATSHRCLDAAWDAGIDFLDTANVYGNGRSERVIGNWLRKSKRDVRIATKASIVRAAEFPVDNSEAHLRSELDKSLQRLGTDHVALFYIHRRDQRIPIEEVAGTLAALVKEGKIGGYGMSEVAPSTLRLAHAVHPCTAIQSEYSLWTRLPELGMIQTCAELGVAFVPFSPLARGMFGETSLDPTQMAESDFRRQIPRLQSPHFAHNMEVFQTFREFAHDNGWTVAGAAIAWVLAQGEHLIPIPGTRTGEHLAEWASAADINFTAAQRAEIDRIMPVGWAHGDRYSYQQMATIERYC